ncbi:hypothetical protein M427DRAFT_38379 [Gonapodya prolifera JEL478]|uniref:Uncharacterized protein n=1 Tax=Gonapodya prolifera (strain JEL478) TaxID=1344416 RepID=A0A138ZZ02_GONPJ|nr:hypothetical protein M427DRAFT_38379 [Gonapodya prolifera JEL478]|eukprot:KXS09737.1 hypothetical protein M427DRAFT_38379 [Gonapodya prolifera JEL478]
MSNNGGPADASSDSSSPVTPSPVANPPKSSTLSTSCKATPASSPRRESASNLPHANARGKKKAWSVSDLASRVDTMDIDPRTPPAAQSRVDGPAPAPPESVVHPVTASDGFLDDVSTNSDEAPNIRFENHRTEKLDPSNVLGSAKRIIMNAKAEGANQAAIKRVLIKMVTREDLLGWLTTMDPTLCLRPLNLYPNTPQWPLPPRTARQMFQFIIAVYASPHYINRMRHRAMAGYWNVNKSGQAVSAETFARDCLTDARDFYTHLDAASLHLARPDSALINSTAINRFRNALTPEQWIQVEDRAQQHGFDFIENIKQLIVHHPRCCFNAARVHVIDADAPPASPLKRAAPTDEGGCQNGKRFKSNGNPNNRKQEHCPQDRDQSPPCGNRSRSRDYDNRGRGETASTAATRRLGSRHLRRTMGIATVRMTATTGVVVALTIGVTTRTGDSLGTVHSAGAPQVETLTEEKLPSHPAHANGANVQVESRQLLNGVVADCSRAMLTHATQWHRGKPRWYKEHPESRSMLTAVLCTSAGLPHGVSVTLRGPRPLGWWGTYGPYGDLACFSPLLRAFRAPAFVSCTAFKSNGIPSVALSPSPTVEADPCLSSGSSSTQGVEPSTYPGMFGDVASLQPNPPSEQPRARLVVPSMSGGVTEPQGDREPLQVSDLDYLLVHYKKHPPKKRTQSGSAGEDGTEPPSKRLPNPDPTPQQRRNRACRNEYRKRPAMPRTQPEPLEMNIEVSESDKPVVIENTDYGADPDLYVDHVACKVQVHLAGLPDLDGAIVEGLPDTGANVECMSYDTYRRFVHGNPEYPRMMTNKRLNITIGNSSTMQPMGRVIMPVDINGFGHSTVTFNIIDGLPYNVILGTGYLRRSGALLDMRKMTIRFPLCKNAQIRYNQYSPPISLAAVRRTARTTAETFTMVTTKLLTLPPGLGTLAVVTPLEHRVCTKLEGEDICIVANPILTARDNLSVPNSFCRVKDGVVAVGIENWSDQTVIVPKGTRIARCTRIDNTEYETFVLKAKPEDAEPILGFDRRGILMTAIANPTLGTARNDIEGLDLTNTILTDEQIGRL